MTLDDLGHVRGALLNLHKALVDLERADYELAHGPVSAGKMLQLLIDGDRFAWLRPISELIVRMDVLMANANERRRPTAARPSMTREQVADETRALLVETRLLFTSDEAPRPFRERYLKLLAHHPAMAVLHRAVTGALPVDRR